MKARKPKLPRLHQHSLPCVAICRADLNKFGEEEACDGCPLINNGTCPKVRDLVEGIKFPSTEPNLPNGTEVSMLNQLNWNIPVVI
jgi:hypothetical protein